MSTKSHHGIDILKALAVIAVILIHTTASHLGTYDRLHTWQGDLNLFVNQALRFSVPLFIALSGFGLAKTFSPKWAEANNLKLKLKLFSDFYLRRVTKLLPWFFAASSIIFVVINNFFTFDRGMYENQPIWKIFLLGRADYHLYFVPMIFQFYLLFPFLYLLIKKFPLLTLATAFLWQIFFYWQITQVLESTNNFNLWPDQQQYFWFFTWIFYFVLGIFLALRSHFNLLKLKLALLILLVGFLWSEFRLFQLINSGIDPIIATRFTQIPTLIFATGFIFTCLSLGPSLLSLLPTRLITPVAYLGRLSFPTYLFHLLVLRFVVHNTPIFSQTPLIFSSTIIIAGSFLLAEITSRIGRLLNRKKNSS